MILVLVVEGALSKKKEATRRLGAASGHDSVFFIIGQTPFASQ